MNAKNLANVQCVWNKFKELRPYAQDVKTSLLD